MTACIITSAHVFGAFKMTSIRIRWKSCRASTVILLMPTLDWHQFNCWQCRTDQWLNTQIKANWTERKLCVQWSGCTCTRPRLTMKGKKKKKKKKNTHHHHALASLLWFVLALLSTTLLGLIFGFLALNLLLVQCAKVCRASLKADHMAKRCQEKHTLPQNAFPIKGFNKRWLSREK